MLSYNIKHATENSYYFELNKSGPKMCDREFSVIFDNYFVCLRYVFFEDKVSEHAKIQHRYIILSFLSFILYIFAYYIVILTFAIESLSILFLYKINFVLLLKIETFARYFLKYNFNKYRCVYEYICKFEHTPLVITVTLLMNNVTNVSRLSLGS